MNETAQVINFLLAACDEKNKQIASLTKELEALKAAQAKLKDQEAK